MKNELRLIEYGKAQAFFTLQHLKIDWQNFQMIAYFPFERTIGNVIFEYFHRMEIVCEACAHRRTVPWNDNKNMFVLIFELADSVK